MIRFHQRPPVLPWFLPKVWWDRAGAEKTLYLTFDDGPIPEVTPFVLEQLALFGAQATFFCVGENLERHAAVAKQALAQGHRLANHTQQHVKAWHLSPEAYLEQVAQCQAVLKELGAETAGPKLFRPPYGQMTPWHLRLLQPAYQVVMWNMLTYDFDETLSPETCLRKAVSFCKPGSVVVFHDSLKAEKNLRYVLPRLLRHFSDQGFSFKTL
ncbi:polysaccharide deacetylase family protein [Rufibacter glacialis]|uniref:Polysaccharide deacetylase family protein n=1 Tax=Rufibacter glacialis TaxID=1259555 RepID=A0A5M8Q9X4_9BACT|nr:polysaccharide deacetylase family protein [Rufibacter glacialis]KAA6431744.1 polysaccharide deacetylase family protein [Rufibacter glacialis]GGK81974.1 polysaccharide deacetylase [Rufibacter glacialis]